MNRFLGLLSALFLTTLFAGFGGAEAQGPRADAPSYQVGDEWKYSTGSTLRVVAIEAGQAVTTSTPNRQCPDCRYYRDTNFTVTKVTDKTGRPLDEPVGFKTLDFPLEVGKQWTSSLDLHPVNAPYKRVHYDNTFTVKAYEEVTTKAGTFKAFKINQYQVSGNLYANNFTGRAGSGSLSRECTPQMARLLLMRSGTTFAHFAIDC